MFPSAIEEEPEEDETPTKSPEESNGSGSSSDVSGSPVSSSNSTSSNISGSVEWILTTDSSSPVSIFPLRSPATKQMMIKLPTKTTPSISKPMPSTVPTSTVANDAKILIRARKGLRMKKRNVIIKHNTNLEKEVAEELAYKMFRDVKNSIQDKHFVF